MKWFGKVGYSINKEISPGLWVPEIIDRNHYGDIVTTSYRNQSSDKTNDNLSISTTISIVADDPFISVNCSRIVYVEYMGAKWRVENIEPKRPRINLTLGGVWNE